MVDFILYRCIPNFLMCFFFSCRRNIGDSISKLKSDTKHDIFHVTIKYSQATKTGSKFWSIVSGILYSGALWLWRLLIFFYWLSYWQWTFMTRWCSVWGFIFHVLPTQFLDGRLNVEIYLPCAVLLKRRNENAKEKTEQKAKHWTKK